MFFIRFITGQHKLESYQNGSRKASPRPAFLVSVRPMRSQGFQFLDITLEIKSESETVLNFFAREFEHFLKPSISSEAQIEIEVTSAKPPASAPRLGVPSSVCLQSWGPGQRTYHYQRGSFATDRIQGRKRKLVFHSASDEEALEEIFYFIQSAVGESLERSGWVRLHACGFVLGDQAIIIPGDSGQGKSTFSLWLLENTNLSLLSDELILTNGKHYLGFPMRISIKNKGEIQNRAAEFWSRSRWKSRWQISIPSPRLHRQPIQGQVVFLPQQSQNFAKWQVRFLMGLGIAQMKEYLLRPSNIGNLFVFLLRRTKILFLLKKNCSNLRSWQSNSANNFEEIKALVQNEKRS